MSTLLVLAYLAAIVVTFITISGDPYIEESPVTAIANMIAAALWPIYWPIRAVFWLSGATR